MDKQLIIAGKDPMPSLLRLGAGESLMLTIIIPEGVSLTHALEIDLDGRVATGIKDFARVYAFNCCHNYSFLLRL